MPSGGDWAQGKWFKVVSDGLDAQEAIDYDEMERLKHEHKPKLIIAGASVYSLRIVPACATLQTAGASKMGVQIT